MYCNKTQLFQSFFGHKFIVNFFPFLKKSEKSCLTKLSSSLAKLELLNVTGNSIANIMMTKSLTNLVQIDLTGNPILYMPSYHLGDNNGGILTIDSDTEF